MSTKYQSSSEVPLKDLITRLNQLSDAVVNDRDRVEFTMRIPAECDRDADLVISEAAVRLQRQDEQIKDYKAKLCLISIAADEGNLEKVKELIPPSCADVVRELQAEAVAEKPPLINLDSLADGNHSFSFKTKNNQKFREIKINIETLPNQLRNPEQDDSKNWVNHEPLREEAITLKLEEQNRELLRIRDKEVRERLEIQKRIEQETV